MTCWHGPRLGVIKALCVVSGGNQVLPRAAPQVTLRLMRSRSEETVVTEDPSRATLIDKKECSVSEDNDHAVGRDAIPADLSRVIGSEPSAGC